MCPSAGVVGPGGDIQGHVIVQCSRHIHLAELPAVYQDAQEFHCIALGLDSVHCITLALGKCALPARPLLGTSLCSPVATISLTPWKYVPPTNSSTFCYNACSCIACMQWEVAFLPGCHNLYVCGGWLQAPDLYLGYGQANDAPPLYR